MLYLLKGSRVREYHQQNVTILGAAEGEHVAISYGPRWVQSGLAVNVGDPCVIVFADSPYDRFVPIRFGILTRIDRPDDRLDVEVRLGAFIRAGGGDQLDERWGRFDRDDPTRPGRIFAFQDSNPGLLAPQSLDEQDDAWRHAIDGLAHNGYFDRSTFARVRSVTDHRGAVLGDQPTKPGEPVSVEVELRTPTAPLDDVGFFLDSTPEGAVDVDASVRLPATGTATIELVPTTPGPISLSLGLLPEALLSSRLTLQLAVVDAEAKKPSPSRGRLSSAVDQHVVSSETRTLISRLRRDATMSDHSWFGLYEDVFLRWDGEDPVILAGYARVAYELGKFTECAAALGRMSGQRRPEDDFLFLLASLQAGEPIEIEPLLNRIDLNTDRDFEKLLGALDHVDTAVLEDLALALTSFVLGEDKLLRFLDRVFPRLQSLTTALSVAEHAAYADPERGADLLLTRWPDATTAPAAVVELLVEWRARANRLGPYLERAILLAETADDWPRVENLAKLARQILGVTERSRLLAQAGEALMLSGNPPMADAGFGLLAEVVAESASRGDLDAAVRHAEALTGFAAIRGSQSLIDAANALREQVTEALADAQVLREWREMRDDNRAKELARHLRGRVLHLVGGQSQPWGKELEITIGFGEVRWHETEKHGNSKTDWADNLDPQRDIVVVLWERIGHAVTTPLKAKCSKRGVPRFESRTSAHDVLEALELVVAAERADR